LSLEANSPSSTHMVRIMKSPPDRRVYTQGSVSLWVNSRLTRDRLIFFFHSLDACLRP
jgi:hypothetical protein